MKAPLESLSSTLLAPPFGGMHHIVHRMAVLQTLLILVSHHAFAGDNALRPNREGEDCIEVQECVVRFGAEIEVPALASGRIAEVSTQQNQPIVAGSQIARLDDRSLLIRRRAADLRVMSAKEEAEDDIEIRYAEVALAEAKAELDNSRSIQNDVRGTIPLTQMRRMRLAVERGQLEVAQAKKRHSRAGVELQLRQADLSAIDDELGNLQADCPIDGIVLELKRNQGEWIEKGSTLARVGQMDRLRVHALVKSEHVSPRHCQGLPVSVHWTDAVDGVSQSLSGTVLSVDPQALPGGRFRLHAEIVNEIAPAKTAKPAKTSQYVHPEHRNATKTVKHWRLVPGTSVTMKVYIPAGSIARKANLNRY